MTLRPVILAGSLAANALLATLWWRSRAVPGPSASAPAPVAAAAPTTRPREIDAETWKNLAPDGDLPAFIARLRAAGYPAEMIRAIVTAQVRARFATRLAPILAEEAAIPFWKARMIGDANPRLALARRAMEREMAEEVLRLLGPDEVPERGYYALVRRREYGAISREKIAEVERIHEDYSDLRGEVYAATRGFLLPEDREKITLLEKERWADIARVLTPAEIEEYELRSSRTSTQLRNLTTAFAPSEEEYRTLFRIFQQLDRDIGRIESLTPEMRRQRTEAEKALAPQIAAALGPERYADYQRTTDPAWRQADRFVHQQDLAPEITGQLAAIQQDITRRVETLRADKTISADERNRRLGALEQEASTRVMPVLGEKTYNTYRETGGYWLRTIRPPAP